MKKSKLHFLFISKVISAVGAITLSALCLPAINIRFFSFDSTAVIWIALSVIAFLFSAVAGYLFRGELHAFDRISQPVLIPILFVLSWIEGIFNQYDTQSARLFFTVAGIIAVIVSVGLSAYWIYNADELRKCTAIQ